MTRADLIQRLRDALQRYAGQPYSRFADLNDEVIHEESGTPSSTPNGDYCHVEIEVLQRWMEGEKEVLHVPVTVDDGFLTFGGDLHFRSDGSVTIGDDLVEFVDGVPRPVAKFNP